MSNENCCSNFHNKLFLLSLYLEFNGTVEKKAKREDGQCTIKVDPTSPLFKNLEPAQKVLLTHGDSITKGNIDGWMDGLMDGWVNGWVDFRMPVLSKYFFSVADGFRVIAKSGDIVAAIANEKQVKTGCCEQS